MVIRLGVENKRLRLKWAVCLVYGGLMSMNPQWEERERQMERAWWWERHKGDVILLVGLILLAGAFWMVWTGTR
jgi:hypothetical protein